ncbi:hypothetical protein BOTNAR_0075g00090 [Botryotinia narcissicola]|uniref:Uncharacterized protein n=1 Tax=Botryotinia narcissicola TaxID=278944 RepID=A0A4Z1IW04_9HELO|nr:hypothetical protein BOTNAR_0075g00090 [Botryotinia narcissicola]
MRYVAKDVVKAIKELKVNDEFDVRARVLKTKDGRASDKELDHLSNKARQIFLKCFEPSPVGVGESQSAHQSNQNSIELGRTKAFFNGKAYSKEDSKYQQRSCVRFQAAQDAALMLLFPRMGLLIYKGVCSHLRV